MVSCYCFCNIYKQGAVTIPWCIKGLVSLAGYELHGTSWAGTRGWIRPGFSSNLIRRTCLKRRSLLAPHLLPLVLKAVNSFEQNNWICGLQQESLWTGYCLASSALHEQVNILYHRALLKKGKASHFWMMTTWDRHNIPLCGLLWFSDALSFCSHWRQEPRANRPQ